MSAEGKMISLAEAEHEIELTSKRIALLHLAFAKTLVSEFGEVKGTELVVKAIKAYGTMVGKEVREAVLKQGLELSPENYGAGDARNLPNIGMHSRHEEIKVDGDLWFRAFGCVMGRVWNELGEAKLGRLYCLVDPAKFMAYNPNYKLSHAKAIPDGDPYCEFCIRRTTKQEQRDFASEDADWTYIDQCN